MVTLFFGQAPLSALVLAFVFPIREPPFQSGGLLTYWPPQAIVRVCHFRQLFINYDYTIIMISILGLCDPIRSFSFFSQLINLLDYRKYIACNVSFCAVSYHNCSMPCHNTTVAIAVSSNIKYYLC